MAIDEHAFTEGCTAIGGTVTDRGDVGLVCRNENGLLRVQNQADSASATSDGVSGQISETEEVDVIVDDLVIWSEDFEDTIRLKGGD